MRVNITVPDDVAEAARAAGLNVSRIASAALVDELDRQHKVASLDEYLAELDATLGPISAKDSAAAARWADRVLSAPAPSDVHTPRRRRSA